MRLLILVFAAFLMNCGDSSPGPLDASIGDLSPRRPDCGSLVDCACRDGSCQQISGCGAMTCADVCATRGGVSGMICDELDGGAH